MQKITGSTGRTGLLEYEEVNRPLRAKFNAEIADISHPVLDEPANREADRPFLRSQRRTPVRRRGGSRFFSRFALGTSWIRALVVVLLVAVACAFAAVGLAVKTFLLRNHHFLLQSADNIQVNGNRVVTRSEALTFFTPDLGKSIFRISLAQRKAQLEKIQWVRAATVMRLWPNQVRVTVAERTPVAFARDGNTVRLVDDQGVLLDLPDGVPQRYSFPVLDGISTADPLSVRAARIAMYLEFVQALDASGGHISSTLSQVDLSDPEDMRAVFLGGTHQPQVHLGDADFLARYQAYQAHLTEWVQQYPALRSVDMRYGKQVVLDTGVSDNESSTPSVISEPADAGQSDLDVAPPAETAATRQSKATVAPAKHAQKSAAVKPKATKGKVTKSSKHSVRAHHASDRKHPRRSEHAPHRGHTVRDPIMHVVTGKQ